MSRCTLKDTFLVVLYCMVLMVITYVIMNDYEMVNTEYEQYWYPAGKLPDEVLKKVLTKDFYEDGFQTIGKNICPSDGNKIKLLIIVESRYAHLLRRIAIRKTWGHFAMRTDVSVGFLMGRLEELNVTKVVRKEQYLYEDLIVNNNIDTYRNLTLKSISMLEFVSTFCRKVLYVVKTDDDTFINIPALIKYVKTKNSSERAIYGRHHPHPEPDRRKYSKHYVSYQLYNKTYYPQFLLGAGYIFTPPLAKELFDIALYLKYLPSEDVYITGFCAEAIKVKRINSRIFYNMLKPENRTTLKEVVNIHQARPYTIWFFMHRAVALFGENKTNDTVDVRSK